MQEEKITIDEEEYFENLNQLVEVGELLDHLDHATVNFAIKCCNEMSNINLVSQHYQEDADGLCTCLGAPLPREGSTTAHIDKSAFEQAE